MNGYVLSCEPSLIKLGSVTETSIDTWKREEAFDDKEVIDGEGI